MKPLTEKQAAVLSFIKSSMVENGYGPTAREISDHFGFASPNAAVGHIKMLESKGFLERKRIGQKAVARHFHITTPG